MVLNDDFKEHSHKELRIVQGFLSSVPERTVRVRIMGERGYLTVKGIGNESGTTRFEWEKEISYKEAQTLLALCEPGIIDKKRYFVNSGAHQFEVDVFGLDNQGLIIAEIELGMEDEAFIKPSWVGEEVTGQIQFYNSSLTKSPFKNWT